MTEDIYAKPDLTKKVKFQKGVEEDTDVYEDSDNVRIYDNFRAEESTPPEKSEDNITEDQQPTVSVNVSSGKRNVFRAAAVLLGLLCLLLLVAVIVLVVLYILERNRLWVKNANLTLKMNQLEEEKDQLEEEKDQLEEEKDHLKATNNNLTVERDELQDRLDERKCCPINWTRFGNSCYLTSTSKKSWSDSKEKCIADDAQLVIISSKEEQEFISSFKRHMWIGLTHEDNEDVWKWVDGTPLNERSRYWRANQPDNPNTEHCVEISTGSTYTNWNDLPCSHELRFTCEKILE